MKFKRIAASLLVLACLVASVGCQKSDLLKKYYDYDPFAYITLGDYKGVTVEVRNPAPTEEEIQEIVDKFLDSNRVVTPTGKATVREGDFVNVTYDGYYLGVKRDGLCEENFELEVGSVTHLEAFEDSLIGRKKGEKYSVTVVYPVDFWNENLRGQQVTFQVTLNDFYKKELPELTNELVYEKLGYSSIENFKTYIAEKLTNDNIATNEKSYVSAVWKKVVENVTIKEYPQDRLKFYEEQSLAYITEMWQQTFPEASFDIFVELMTNKSYDEFMAEIRANCESVVKDELVLLAIAKQEGIVIDMSVYKKYARNYLTANNVVSISELEKKISREELCLNILSDIINEIVGETANVVTKQ